MSFATTKNNQDQTSILVLGATGATGLACIEKLAEQTPRPSIHAFCRNTTKLDSKTSALCKSVFQGDARKSSDIARALRQTNSNWVLVAVGHGHDLSSKNDIRTLSGKAISNVLQSDPAFEHVRIMVVSSNGAGRSKIVVGMGIGSLISFHLRHVLKDHTGQETAFEQLKDRAIVVRPTSLTSDAPTGKLVEFGDTVKGPSIQTDRADLAEWVAEAIASGKDPCVVNLTGVKKQ